MRQKLILAADDFGGNYLANQNILKLINSKKIDRVAVIINGSLREAEIESLKISGVKIDLHLVFVALFFLHAIVYKQRHSGEITLIHCPCLVHVSEIFNRKVLT